jgi:hypothetical protein
MKKKAIPEDVLDYFRQQGAKGGEDRGEAVTRNDDPGRAGSSGKSCRSGIGSGQGSEEGEEEGGLMSKFGHTSPVCHVTVP